MGDPKDYPAVSFRVLGEAESQKESMKRVVVEITLDRALNGFYGDTVSLEVHVDSTMEAIEAEVDRMVKWTVEHRTGHTIPAPNFVNAVASPGTQFKEKSDKAKADKAEKIKNKQKPVKDPVKDSIKE